MSLDELAQFLGITVQDVTAALENGESLTQLAQARGKSREDVKAFLFRKFQDYATQHLMRDGSTAPTAA